MQSPSTALILHAEDTEYLSAQKTCPSHSAREERVQLGQSHWKTPFCFICSIELGILMTLEIMLKKKRKKQA